MNENEVLAVPVAVPEGQPSLDLLLRLAEAVEKVAAASETAGRKGEQAGQRQKSAWDSVMSSIASAPDTLGNIAERYMYITEAVDNLLGRLEGLGELAEEQERLSEMSSRLALDYDEAAEAGGRFTDEVDAMNASGEFFSRGVRLSATELSALTRVAGAASVMLSESTTQAVQELTEALVSGRERGLARFGYELAETAGRSTTLRERLAVLVSQAEHTTAATDNSADAVRRLRDRFDDYKRTAATAFLQETERLLGLGGAAHTTAGDMETLTTIIGGVASAVATMAAMVIGSVRLLVTEAASEVSRLGNALGLVSDETNNMWTHMRDDALDNLERQYAERNGEGQGTVVRQGQTQSDSVQTPQWIIDRINRHEPLPPDWDVSFSGGRIRATRRAGSEDDRSVTSATTRGEATTDTARRLREGVSYQPRNATEERMLREREADAIARDRHDPNEANAATRREMAAERRGESAAARAEREREAEDRARIERENREQEQALREAHRAAEATRGPGGRRGGFMERALDGNDNLPEDTGLDLTDYAAKDRAQRAAADAAGASSDEGRATQAAKDRQAARERRAQDDRIAALRSFTDQFEDMHGRQVNASRMMAEGVTQAFNAVGEAMGKHFTLWRQGRETLGEALRGMLSDTLIAIGKEATVKGSMQIAEGLANLIIAPPLAAQNFAAAGAYFGVAALAGAAGEAMAPSTTRGAAGAGAGPSRAAVFPANDNQRAATMGNYTWNYYAPVFGGRDGGRAEVGQQLGRYTTADAERTRRAA